MSAHTTEDEKGTAEATRSWFAYLRQGETWISASGSPIKIKDMNSDWRANAAAWLLRRASVLELYSTTAELATLVSTSENLQDAMCVEMDRRSADPEAWLKTTALYRALTGDEEEPIVGAEEFEDIRARLEAVAGVDWGEIEREEYTEYCADWLLIGPAMVLTMFSPGPAGREEAKRDEAVAEFIQHAAADMRRLLDAIESPKPSE